MSSTLTASFYLKNKQFSQAATLLEKHVSENPDDLGSLDLLGRAYFELHNFQDACDVFTKLHRLDRTNIEWTHLLARCLFRLGNFKKAHALASYVVKHEGPTVDNLLTCGLAAQKRGLKEEAEANYRSIIKIDPMHADALHNLATLIAAKKQFSEAIQLFEKSYKINPANKGALANAIYYARSASAWIVERTYASEIKSLGVEGGIISPFSMLALDDDPSRHQARSRTYWQTMTQGIERRASHHPLNDRMKVGYFSSDFFDHATMHLFADIIRYHDRSRFEIFGYVINNPKIDQVSREALALFDHVKDVSAQTDKRIAEIAREDQIDLAIDLKGFTSFSRPEIFAYGAGKVQINYLGYPGTMGTPMMDYIIADHIVIPPSHEQYYDEKVLRLPGCYQPNRHFAPTKKKVSREMYGLPQDVPVLASFNAIYKVGLEEFLIWMQVLQKHRSAVLWVICDNNDAYFNLLHLGQQQGITSDRIIRALPVPHDEHIARIGLADLFVDTFMVCAHTTASDALRAGLPIVTKLGSAFASRVAASILESCGLGDWIVNSDETYFEKIDAYLTDGQFAAEKQRIVEAVTKSDLFDPLSYTKNLESLYLEVFNDYLENDGGSTPGDTNNALDSSSHGLIQDKGSCSEVDADAAFNILLKDPKKTLNEPADSHDRQLNKISEFIEQSESSHAVRASVISLDFRSDRRDRLRQNFSDHGVDHAIYKFIKAEFIEEFGFLGCSLSHIKALEEAKSLMKESDADYYYIFEDDLRFSVQWSVISNAVEMGFRELDADLILLNATPLIKEPLSSVNFDRAISAFSTAGYAISLKFVDQAISAITRSVMALEGLKKLVDRGVVRKNTRQFEALKSRVATDCVWQELFLSHKVLIPSESWTIQESGFSDIEARPVDYKSIQEWSAKKPMGLSA